MKWTNRQCWLQGLTASAEVSRCRPQFSSCWRASALLLTLSTNFFIVARRWLGVQRVWALRSYQHHTCPDENTQTHQSPIHTSQKLHTLARAQNKELQHQSCQPKDFKKSPKPTSKTSVSAHLYSWSLTCNLLTWKMLLHLPAINLSWKCTYSIKLSTSLFACFVCFLLLWGYANCIAFVLIRS